MPTLTRVVHAAVLLDFDGHQVLTYPWFRRSRFVLTVTQRGRERVARDCPPEPAACPQIELASSQPSPHQPMGRLPQCGEAAGGVADFAALGGTPTGVGLQSPATTALLVHVARLPATTSRSSREQPREPADAA